MNGYAMHVEGRVGSEFIPKCRAPIGRMYFFLSTGDGSLCV